MFTYDLVDLRLFSAAARAGSVSQAASEVHLAVSSASARLKAFEARSGVKLFERRPHGVDLTPVGSLTHLTSLNLYVDDSRSVDLSPLAGLPSLVNLSVNGEVMADWPPS